QARRIVCGLPYCRMTIGTVGNAFRSACIPHETLLLIRSDARGLKDTRPPLRRLPGGPYDFREMRVVRRSPCACSIKHRSGQEDAEALKFCPEGGAAAHVGVSAREQRKVVTVLFCDVTGSTSLGESLDPESLRALLARYFERMKAIVERHGGTVEKFIGDAVMAVFGVPVLHEDDALRAMRAAMDMRDALPELGLQARIGVMTGEVVTGTEERLATGDA